MQALIAALITGCMASAVVFFPIRLARGARTLGFSRDRQMKVAVTAFCILGTWFGLVVWGALTGFFQTPVFSVFGIPFTHVNYLVLGPVILGSLLMWFSPTTCALIDTLSPYRLMLFETARTVGVVFLVRYVEGGLPGIFALPAGIGDVFIGCTAPLISYLYRRYGERVRILAIGWNILGLVELAMSLVIGYLVFGLRVFPGVEVSNTGVPTGFPLVLIPGFGVPLMVLVHIIALRVLRRMQPLT